MLYKSFFENHSLQNQEKHPFVNVAAKHHCFCCVFRKIWLMQAQWRVVIHFLRAKPCPDQCISYIAQLTFKHLMQSQKRLQSQKASQDCENRIAHWDIAGGGQIEVNVNIW